MAASSDDSDSDDLVTIGTPVPEISGDQPLPQLTTVHDLTARDKEGRRRFHGAFTGGFSAGYFNTVGSKEGFTPLTFSSSRSKRHEQTERTGFRPEDFMDEEDLEEHGIAPRKFSTVMGYTSEERKRKLVSEANQMVTPSGVGIAPAFVDLMLPEKTPIGIKLLQKMGWREGQGLGPRKRKKKKTAPKTPDPGLKVYGCAMPPLADDESDSDEFVPKDLESIKFAPKDVCPISLDVKDDVHGLGYHGLDSRLALPSSHVSTSQNATFGTSVNRKGIRGQAFGVGVFEDEDEDIYAQDNLSNYDLTMQTDKEVDDKFGWTAPRQHGKQTVPVTYVGKLLEGFCLSSKPLLPKKKYPPPTLPSHFKPQHWFRKKRLLNHVIETLQKDSQETQSCLTATDRGLLLGETPIITSVFDLVKKEDLDRIDATKQAIAMTRNLKDVAKNHLSSKFQAAETLQNTSEVETSPVEPLSQHSQHFLSRFKPADSHDTGTTSKVPLFQGSLNFQPFRKDPVKQERYEKYLMHLKQEVKDPYSLVASTHLTEWEKSREKEEFAKASKIFRPMSAMMSARFVRGAMIDDEQNTSQSNLVNEVTDQAKAAEMGMFGQLTHEVIEWHPNSLLCKRFNVPNPYPGSDVVGVPSVRREKFSVFNFLSFNDYQLQDITERGHDSPPAEKTLKPVKRPTMSSVFKVLDDPTFNSPISKTNKVDERKDVKSGAGPENASDDEEEELKPPDMDLFRAIFKNSDSEDVSDKEIENTKALSSEDEVAEKVELDIIQEESSSPSRNKITEIKSNENLAVAISPPSLQSKIFSIFDVLNESNDVNIIKTADIQNEDVECKPYISATEEATDEYGPKLPPGLTVPNTSTSESNFSIREVQLFQEKHNKKHKHKKEKKKKSKHKKNKKHKTNKSKKGTKDILSSGAEADSESDS